MMVGEAIACFCGCIIMIFFGCCCLEAGTDPNRGTIMSALCYVGFVVSAFLAALCALGGVVYLFAEPIVAG